jgi:atypical dual specificity phosphatase
MGFRLDTPGEERRMQPVNFSWVVPGQLAGFSRPRQPESLDWLRSQGVELILTLTETPLPRAWVNDAGILMVHEPIPDYHAPTLEQLERCVESIHKAHAQKMGVGVHCHAGIGRTGTILAAFLISQGKTMRDALRELRAMRPGSVETNEQEDVLVAFEGLKRD